MSHLMLDAPQASALHAELVWTGTDWTVQDLGSRNGTFLDGQRLTPGQCLALGIGSQLRFGVEAETFRVLDLEAPRLIAVSDEGEILQATTDWLSLPNQPSERLLTILQRRDGSWVLESEDGERELRDQDRVTTSQGTWQIHLPVVATGTREVPRIDIGRSDFTLTFQVSRDQEHVTCEVADGDLRVHLDSRAHTFLLLVLARARVEDRSSGNVAEVDEGWVHRDDLCSMMKVDLHLLNLWIHRARKQLTKAGVAQAARIVERRASSLQMRIGTASIAIHES